jgi:hypothetical protein
MSAMLASSVSMHGQAVFFLIFLERVILFFTLLRLDGTAIRKPENRKFTVFSGHSVVHCSGKRVSHVNSCPKISGDP